MPDKLPSAESLIASIRPHIGPMICPPSVEEHTGMAIDLIDSAFAAIRADEARIQSERYAACVEALKELIAGKDKHLFETWTETPADEEPTHVERCCRAIDLWSKARKALAELEGKGKI